MNEERLKNPKFLVHRCHEKKPLMLQHHTIKHSQWKQRNPLCLHKTGKFDKTKNNSPNDHVLINGHL